MIGGVSNIELLYSCFNQFLFQTAKDNITSLKYYYQTNPNTSGNALVSDLIQAIQDYDLENIGLPLFQGIIMRHGKTQAEYEQIMGEILKYKQLTKEQIEPARRLISDIRATILLKKAGEKFKDSPSEYIDYIKGLNFKSSESSVDISPTNFASIDINTMVADGMLGGYPSRFELINDAFQPECGYPSRGLVMVAMPPGCGKSLFLEQELLNFCAQGHKCHLLNMGDLSMLDVVVRLCAIYYGVPFPEVKMNLPKYYSSLKKILGDRLEITILPSGVLTIEEYIEFAKSRKDIKIFGIDYDSNFANKIGSSEENSMYLYYGKVYSALSEITVSEKKLVFILAQPTKNAWVLPERMATIELDQIGESSRKQHMKQVC